MLAQNAERVSPELLHPLRIALFNGRFVGICDLREVIASYTFRTAKEEGDRHDSGRRSARCHSAPRAPA